MREVVAQMLTDLKANPTPERIEAAWAYISHIPAEQKDIAVRFALDILQVVNTKGA
jgi:hypothetical protein